MVKQGYKQTEVGVIPEDWNIVALEILATDMSDGPFGSNLKKEHYTDEKQARIIQLSNIGENGWLDSNVKYTTFSHAKTISRCIVQPGHIIIAKMMPAGRAIICPSAEKMYVLGSDSIKLELNNTLVNTAYFMYSTKSDFFQMQIKEETQGSTRARTSISKLRKNNVFLPPIAEQEHIAEALSDVDAMISSLEKLIAKKKAVKQGAMQGLLTGKKRLPGFTGEWYETTIGEHCYVFDGTHQTPKYTIAGIPFYSVENVTANDFVNTRFITAEEHEQLSSKCKIKKGDILMTRIGSIGDCKYIDWDVNASFYVSLALIKCKETINARFLSFYSTSSYFKKEIEIRSLLTAIPQKINLGPISEIRLYIPSDIQEQEAIASILSDMDNEIEALKQKLAKASQIKQGMMQQLLTGKIRLV